MTPPHSSHPLILLHGLWMRGIALTVLQRRLEHAGYSVETFDYLSTKAPLDATLERLRSDVRAHPAGVDVVGHSLGGLLAMLACHRDTSLPPGRIVCMASPVTGSAVARQLAERGGSWLLGRHHGLLEHGLERWDGPREVGMIAGTMGMGLGVVVGHLEGESDGTVAVAETRLPGLTDHCVVPTSHTGMLFSAATAAQAIAFLRDGRFER